MSGPLFDLRLTPEFGPTPIYDQLRRETGLDPAPSEWEKQRRRDAFERQYISRLGLELRNPANVFLAVVSVV